MGVAHTCCNVCSKMAAISADALDDDWWREEDEEAADSRKRKESSDTTSIKKKRKTITQKLRTERIVSFATNHSSNSQRTIFEEFLNSNLKESTTVVEMDELKLSSKHFVGYHGDNEPDFNQYFSSVCHKLDKWAELVKDQRGSPCVIILCSSAVRALELRQLISKTCDVGSVAKLFAKHMKFEDQKKLLQQSVTPVAVATPDRLSRLLNEGAIDVSRVKRIVIDWNWRNKKLKRISDIPEVRKAMCELYRDHLNDIVSLDRVKLALY